ncbi:MAG: Nitroreductase family protein [Candidatus Methanofastidiosum methylothiophilum]|uniref:Nitroreductase family protein n=1 Tax=Candidatus Methanofastidiosum methylothiophilum TaxID=1705564 RepID=A0A150J682_9EURY|nr:MAG: Nitroreductase family protein [Candidatus Methanofastidiosum methylthiophilus]NMC77670.1 hypothetical protein [Candidatus Methanofastidiosa archaeon]
MLEKIDWESAINVRRSVRSFEMREVDKDSMDKLKIFMADMEASFTHNIKIRFFKANSDKKLYSTFNSPPDDMAFISNTDIVSISKVGFIGELAILYATNLGISTCWYGHYSLEELEKIMPHLGENNTSDNPKWGYGKGVVEGERAICISPLGYWKKDGLRLADRVTGSFMSYKRKEISELLQGSTESLTPELLYALDLSRKAPSGANSQHWRFKVSSDLKTISISMPVGYKHIKWEHPDVDIGICACHFWLGLLLKGIQSKVSVSEEEGRAVWQFEI